ncbi:MAG TPA: glutaredoxin family protein [Lacunisphaera sp.]|jgi:glutaredoxin|nr:glutaredoxin family protein [Lacunisphaera sp.]
MTDESLPVLFVKTGCPWCEDAARFLSDHGVGFREQNVTVDRSAYDRMRQVSGQTKAPVLDWHGEVLADFGVDELKEFLWQHGRRLEDS